MALTGALKLGVLFLWAATLGWAADSLTDAPPFSLPAKDLLAESNSKPAAKGEDSVVLLDEDRLTFDKNGDLRRSMHVVVQLATAEGVEEWSNLEYRWEPWHEKRPAIRVRVITPDGVEHPLDPSTIVDGAAGNQENNMYSDARAVKCPLPALTPGAVIEQEIEINVTHVLSGMLTQAYFGRGVPVRLARTFIEYPDELPLSYTAYLLPELKTSKTSEGGVTRIKLEAGPLTPREPAEPLLPPDVPRDSHLAISTGRSWNELAVAYNKIVEERLAHSDVADIVKAARSQAKDRAQLIEHLVRQLHNQVRYTGVEFGEAAIVPAEPAETLKRKYGDCKDKSTLLVSMLRAAGIPSHLALLEAGPGQDVTADHPGMGMFDHAIVYVPGSPDLWIDATAEYLHAGFLPAMDQGRQALVIRPETTVLTTIPESPSAANVSIETREFFLPDYGKARVVESNEGTGNTDAALRANYGSADTEQLRKNLGRYMREEYLADAELKIDHPKANDFSGPFRLRLEMDQASRASVSQVDGAVGMPLGILFEKLPAYFKNEDKKPNAEDAAKPAKQRTDDFVLNEAFVSERHYKIHLPPGFQAMNVPEPQTLHWGPANFSSAFRVEKDEIYADFRFDCGKRRYTAEEGAELKKDLVEFFKKPVLVLGLQPVGQAYLAKGQIKEAIDQYTAMTKQYPNKAIYRVQLSNALLAGGCGRKAREEARRATEIEPKSGVAFQNLGFVLLNDLVGRQFAKGFDAAGAEAALRKALEIDSKDQVSRRNLGVLLEHSTSGERYTAIDRLNQSIQVYRDMGDDLMANNLEPNLLYDLVYAGRFQELRKELEKLPVNSLTLSFKLVATSKLETPGAALAQAEKETSDEGTRSSALQTAGEILLALREYEAASQLLAAGAKGAQNPTQVVSRANAMRLVKRIDDIAIKTDTPENTIRSAFIASLLNDDSFAAFEKLEAEETLSGLSANERHKQLEMFARGMMSSVMNAGLSRRVFLDLTLSITQFKIDENGSDGCRVHVIIPGSTSGPSYFLAKNGAEYRILGETANLAGVGRRIWADVKKGDLSAARRWLDWIREDVKIAGGDDPLDGPVFPRLWSKGSQGDEKAINTAAAVLVGDTAHGKDAIRPLREALDQTQAEPAKTYMQIAYAIANMAARQWPDALSNAKALAEAHPDSPRMSELLISVYLGMQRWADAEAAAKQRLARDADEVGASRLLADARAGAGEYQESETLFRKLAESPKGTPSDWNSAGWFSLFAGDLSQEKIAGMQQAMNNSTSAGMLHTLAAMYAEAGKSTEARETIFAAMRFWGLEEPDGLCWLVFGSLAEKFGVMDEAIADYQLVKGTEEDGDSPYSSYALAQKRLALLKKR